MLAAQRGCIEVINWLISQGADVNALDDMRQNALFYVSDESDVADTLIQKGANINQENKRGLTPLLALCEKGFVNASKKLLEHNADCNKIKEITGDTALHLVIRNNPKNALDCAKLLIDSNANIEIPNNFNVTPLQEAFKRNKQIYDYMQTRILDIANFYNKLSVGNSEIYNEGNITSDEMLDKEIGPLIEMIEGKNKTISIMMEELKVKKLKVEIHNAKYTDLLKKKEERINKFNTAIEMKKKNEDKKEEEKENESQYRANTPFQDMNTIEDLYDLLNKDIEEFISAAKSLKESEILERNDLIEKVKIAVNKKCPNTEFFIYGSSATDTWLPFSDIDILLISKKSMMAKNLIEEFRQQSWLSFVKEYDGVIRVEGKTKKSLVNIYITIQAQRDKCLEYVKLIYYYKRELPFFDELLLLLKQVFRIADFKVHSINIIVRIKLYCSYSTISRVFTDK